MYPMDCIFQNPQSPCVGAVRPREKTWVGRNIWKDYVQTCDAHKSQVIALWHPSELALAPSQCHGVALPVYFSAYDIVMNVVLK